ncbi:MAG TPA: protein kinase, partial [Blastocatellia bacterium]|nr:protein kinase [Blastocatellia bacterium]
MPLTPGTKLGPYEITSALGAGGMGEVYCANDTRLDRIVAIKVLPTHLAHHSELRQRFEREARAISSLAHPHICTLYDVGQQDGIDYLVMEYLEGESLAQRLEKGALPLEQTLRYATQIAAALAKAHRAGIVHRDLKPGNVMLTKAGAKLLDFGLAKLTGNTTPVLSADSEAPTQKLPITGAGTILGTFQYMAPEQLEGREADQRTDIFALGAVIYEMATGRRAFTGKTQASLITAIMSAEPEPMAKLQPLTPPALERLVKKCLAKDADDRWQSAHDIADELQWIGEGGTQTVTNAATVTQPVTAVTATTNKWQWLAWGVAAVLLLSTLAFAVAYFRRAPAESRANYTYLPWPASVSGDNGSPVFSPDGRRIAFTAVTEGTNHIWLYLLDAPDPVRVPGTEGARFPFWSPDSRHLGFFSGGKLKRIEAAGGTPEILCDAINGSGGTWNSAGVILFAPTLNSVGLYQVSDRGGVPTPATSLDGARLEIGHVFPRFLPDGRRFVFLARSAQPENIGIKLGSLDQPQTSFLLRSDTNAEYSTAGYLIFLRGEKILAQRFDAEARSLRGDPVTLAEQGNRILSAGYSPLSVCEDKWLLYQSGGNPNTQLAWFDRSGRQQSLVGTPGQYRWLNLSPNGTQVLLERFEPQKVRNDLWSFDLARETYDRLTSDSSSNIYPFWSPDGKHISFGSNREGRMAIWQKGVNGNDDKEELVSREEARSILQSDWSNDGKYLVYWKDGEKTANDLWLLPLFGDRQPKPYLTTQFEENWGKVSPNGRWLVYQSNESGRNEIYVQAFPEPGR